MELYFKESLLHTLAQRVVVIPVALADTASKSIWQSSTVRYSGDQVVSLLGANIVGN